MEDVDENTAFNDDEICQQGPGKEAQGYDVEAEMDEITDSLTENMFSLIYIAETTGSAFSIAIFFVAFQLTMISLVLVDLIEPNNPDNPFNVPNNVSGVVRVAGFMSLTLSVALFWDMMDAIDKLLRGPAAVGSCPNATRLKFYAAFSLQLAIGILFLIAIFILVAQSTEVVSMFLNFAALQFITDVDDIAFKLAALGYLGESKKLTSKKVKDYKLPHPKRPYLRCRIYYLVTILFFIGYSIIFSQQHRGNFDCQRIEVQFSDGFIPHLPLFSGYYTRQEVFHDGRPVYKDERGKAAFRYCHEGGKGYWVFGLTDNMMGGLCANFVSRSPHTSGYGLTDTSPSDWFIKKDSSEVMEYMVDYFMLRCNDCTKNTCNGSCKGNACICGEGFYGSNCAARGKPCERIDYNRNTHPFNGVSVESDSGIFFSSEFILLERSDGKPVFVYGRPIYVRYRPGSKWVEIIMYIGRRYAVFSYESKSSADEFINDFEDFHPYDSWEERLNSTRKFWRPKYISGPIDIGTTTDSYTPTGLTWYRTKSRPALSVGTSVATTLICAGCDDLNRCLNYGQCISGNCNCTAMYEGSRCEKEDPCVWAGNCGYSSYSSSQMPL